MRATDIGSVTHMLTDCQVSLPPDEMAEPVRAKVAVGDCATESDDIRDGRRALLSGSRAVQDWLQQTVDLSASPEEERTRFSY